MATRLSQARRKAIRARDNQTCAICKTRVANGNSKIELQVHHIIPYQYGLKFLKWSRERINSCFNLITLCSLCHGGDRSDPSRFCIHSDVLNVDIGIQIRTVAGQDYEKALKSVEDARSQMAELGIKYWNDSKDLELSRIALKNTKDYINKNGYKACKDLFRSFEDESRLVETTIRKYSDNCGKSSATYSGEDKRRSHRGRRRRK